MKDFAHEKALQYRTFIRVELILWFGLMILGFFVLLYALYQWNSVTSTDYNRGYISVNDQRTPLVTTSRLKPHRYLSNTEILEWAKDHLIECMTFDHQSYEIVKAKCTSEIFSTNRTFNDQRNLGQLFYDALETAEVIRYLKANKTSMTIDIMDSNFVDEKLKTYHDPDRKLRPKQVYTYQFEIEFRILMHGQDLDAPIVYDVQVERMNEAHRRIALGIRSVISK